MTRRRVTEILYTAVYMVVRRGGPMPSLEEFLSMRIGNLLPESSPSDWPTFWEEVLVSVMEDLFAREGIRIDGLTPRIFSRSNKKMKTIRDWLADHAMPIQSSGEEG